MSKVPHKKVVYDYLRGLKYREITKKYGITRGGVQYALEKAGVSANRIRSSARMKDRRKNFKRGSYLDEIPIKEETKEDNNPVRVDDLDPTERYDFNKEGD